MAAAVLPPQALKTTLGYHLEPERGGEEVWCPGTVRDKRRPHEHVDVLVRDIRGHEADYSLDVQGFEIGPFDTTIDNVPDSEYSGKYYEEVCAHVKKITNASRVLPVVHIVRRRPWAEVANAEKDLPDDSPVIAPTYNRAVHVDQSYWGATIVRDSRLESIPEEEAQRLKNCRWAIINLWRPIENVVTRDNLAVCDARTVEEEDLTAVYADLPESLRNAKTGYNFAAKSRSEAWEVKANPGSHKWYYASRMTPKEALLIKQFDSRQEGVARRCPHSAFSAEQDYGPTRLVSDTGVRELVIETYANFDEQTEP